ncbi:MAG TPA: hypothetical protein VFG14_06270 [Chthoniobacteraceae bacterium]|jgi:hypothetical protein|nr:hypothetical protein [Chthoniobacteraceae bacterium]
MTRAAEERLIRTGCVLVLIGSMVLGYLALAVHWGYGGVAAALIVAWILVGRSRAIAAEQIELESLREIFLPTGRSSPILERSSRYGYPAWTLIFPSKADFDAAESSGCISAFKVFIQSRYAHVGSKDWPFDAERAIEFVYEAKDPA